MATVIHLGTQIVASFAVLDDDGNAFAVRPEPINVLLTTPEARAAAWGQWEEQRAKLVLMPDGERDRMIAELVGIPRGEP